jgi:tRNA-dihydrouridine synthase
MLRHLKDMVRLVGEDIGVREMRKHLCWYTKGLPGGAELRERINHLGRVAQVRAEIESYFVNLFADEHTRKHAHIISADSHEH